jgi:hypothetical protein
VTASRMRLKKPDFFSGCGSGSAGGSGFSGSDLLPKRLMKDMVALHSSLEHVGKQGTKGLGD